MAVDRRLVFASVRKAWSGLSAPIWGETDCVCYALAMLTALRGRNAREDLDLKSWTSKTEAAKIILTRAKTISGLHDAVEDAAERIGLQRVYSLMAQPGDLCIVHAPVRHGDQRGSVVAAPGIIDAGGTGAAAIRVAGVAGLYPVARRDIRRAWKVEPVA